MSSAPASDHKTRSAPSWPVFSSLAGYAARYLGRDIVAGLVLVAVAIPEQMATARLGGFAPEIGLVAFIVGSIAFAIFGANRFLSVGADSTITPIFAAGLALLAAGGGGNYAAMAALLALAVGAILIACGIFRLGWIADLLSAPVTNGFLAGIAVNIVILQLPDLLGLAPAGGSLFARLGEVAAHFDRVNPYATALGLGVFAVTLGGELINRRLPGALIGLAAATLGVSLFALENRGVAVLGVLNGTLPHLALPAVKADELLQILPLALLVSIVVMLQTAATTRSFPSNPGEPPAVNRDFAGVGVGALAAGLLGAFPVNASPPRTAVVAETGGRSQIAGLIATALTVALIAFGGRLLTHVPQAALAGILMFIAVRLVRVREIASVYRRAPGEFALILATLAAMVALPLEIGVAVGIVLSLMHGMWTATRASLIEFEQVPGTTVWWAPNSQSRGERLPGVMVVAFQAPLSFLNAYDFRSEFLDALARAGKPLRLVVLEASSMIAIDFTASKVLADVIDRCRSDGIAFAVSRLESERAQAAFARFGLLEKLGPDHMFHSVDQAIRALAQP